MAGKQYLFPILKHDEVILHCKDLFNLHVTEEDLKRPTPQFVKKFYLEAVTKILDTSPEAMLQPNFQLLTDLRYPELSEEATPIIFFTMLLQRFMYTCSIEDFNKNDLLLPLPKRTLVCMSGVINFAMFKGTLHQFFMDILKDKDTLKTQRVHLRARNEELAEKIAQIKAKRAEEEEQVQQIYPKVDELEKLVYDINKQQAQDRIDTQQLRTELAERASKEAALKATIANDKDLIEKLKAEIVTSPDKFRAELAHYNKAIESCKASKTEKTQTLLELNNQMDSIRFLEENALRAVKMIKSVEEEAEKLVESQKTAQEIHEAVNNDEDLVKGKTNTFENLKRHFASQNEKLARLETKNAKKVSSTNFSIQQAEKEQELCKHNMKDVQQGVSEIEQESKKILKEYNENEKGHQEEMDDMKYCYQQLLNQLDVYHKSLEKGWEELAQSLAG